MPTITLNCLVSGENPYENAFQVVIDTRQIKTVALLKDAIKEKNTQAFANVDAKDIKLWKVDISLEKENEKLDFVNAKKINVNIKDELGGVELPPLSKISKNFSSQPADEHIHIIVQRPTETKEVHITASYNRTKKNFQWTVTREMVSLTELKKKLCEFFTFPDGTEDEHIVIGRVMGGVERRISKSTSEMESATVDMENVESAGRNIINFSKDEDLAGIVWIADHRVVELNIVVDTSQQPFNSYTFSKMKALFGLQYDNCDELPKCRLFPGDLIDSFLDKKILEEVIQEILRKHTVSRPIRADVNEATRREFISSIIYGVASNFRGLVKIYPEEQVTGTHGKGPVDWIIKIGNIIICVTEAKRNDISWGIGQSTVQAHASMQLNTKKRTFTDANLDEDDMYCIISTGVEWVITRVIQNRDGKVDVYICDPMPDVIPINNAVLTYDDLYKPVKKLCRIINELFHEMKDAEKRVKLS
ncbi:hypothetical protein RhiirA4_540534 [Rhizophagus irregularis]|uniref:Crinkler effector protein N-terminal domain-containing protein n=1 Tax=Rhizophagus irregularis TaxID=588596 RepID=A0A2I1G7K1_9GLOM|nr:hypothetical protein RhiirA4_540534 [Rhizophagus irregularis]